MHWVVRSAVYVFIIAYAATKMAAVWTNPIISESSGALPTACLPACLPLGGGEPKEQQPGIR